MTDFITMDSIEVEGRRLRAKILEARTVYEIVTAFGEYKIVAFPKRETVASFPKHQLHEAETRLDVLQRKAKKCTRSY